MFKIFFTNWEQEELFENPLSAVGWGQFSVLQITSLVGDIPELSSSLVVNQKTKLCEQLFV